MMPRFPFLGKCFLLLFIIMICLAVVLSLAQNKTVQESVNGGTHGKVRKKREWIIPPPHLEENKDYTKKPYIAKVRSDKGGPNEKLIYDLHGAGVDQPPLDLFVLNRTNGFVRITGILDREVAASYILYASARFAKNLTLAEDHLKLIINVTDVNDNEPKFHESGLPPGSVYETSPKGTFVTKVHATDADQTNTLHTELRYTIIKQEPNSKMMFYIQPKTGEIKVKEPTLDREKQSAYVLTVKATDMDGSPAGKTGTGTVNIMILDINDNRPFLENRTYTAIIEENADNLEVMRFNPSDRDEVGNSNWRAKYEIVSGNEDGYFSIETDPETNQGILMLKKPVDYEHVKELNLEVVVDNEAPYEFTHGTIKEDYSNGKGKGAGEVLGRAGRKKYPVNIKVKNMPDGPKFIPAVKPLTISEDNKKITVPMVLTSYPAVDEDTGQIAKNVRYAKGSDPAGWLAVDSDTGDIKLTRVPDRESKHVVDGTYHAKILCITDDLPAKTATGTLAIHIEDVNDHCPELTSNYQKVCTEDKVVFVSAHDRDGHSSSPPFTFRLLNEGTAGSWDMKPHNDNTVILKAQDALQPRPYVLAFEIMDKDGHTCSEPEVLDLIPCYCFKDRTCKPTGTVKSAARQDQRKGRGTFGGPALGIVAAAFLLLLLVPLLLLVCSTGGGLLAEEFAGSPFTAKEHLIIGHTEIMGEDKDISLLAIPVQSKPAPVFGPTNVPTISITRAGTMNTESSVRAVNVNTVSSVRTGNLNTISSVRTGNLTTDSSMRGTLQGPNDDVFEMECFSHSGADEEDALQYAFLAEYYTKKSRWAAEGQDSLRVYEYEGEGSAAGSMSCCAELEVDHRLDFLDHLDSKFTTLAQMCKPQESVSKVTIATTAGVTKRPPPSPGEEVSMEKVNVKAVNVEKVNAEKVNVGEGNAEKVNAAVTSSPTSRMVREEVMVQNQAYVIQQPVYLATAPLVQTQYVVHPQVQPTVLVPDNLQGLYVVSDAPGPEKVVLQESRVMAGPAMPGGAIGVSPGSVRGEGLVLVSHESHKAGSGPGVVRMGSLSRGKSMVLLENQVLQGSLLRQNELNGAENVVFVRRSEQDTVHLGENVMLMEGQVGAGQMFQGGQSWIQQGTLQRGTISGSQNVLLVEREGAGGQAVADPVSPQQILPGSPAGLPSGSVQKTSLKKAFVF